MTTPDTTAIREKMQALDGYTPGPWRSSGENRVRNVEGRTLADVNYAEATGTHNARLIATAPDMRDTILALCDEVDRLRAENERSRLGNDTCTRPHNEGGQT